MSKFGHRPYDCDQEDNRKLRDRLKRRDGLDSLDDEAGGVIDLTRE